jgi:hypothetical protein
MFITRTYDGSIRDHIILEKLSDSGDWETIKVSSYAEAQKKWLTIIHQKYDMECVPLPRKQSQTFSTGTWDHPLISLMRGCNHIAGRTREVVGNRWLLSREMAECIDFVGPPSIYPSRSADDGRFICIGECNNIDIFADPHSTGIWGCPVFYGAAEYLTGQDGDFLMLKRSRNGTYRDYIFPITFVK